MSITFFFMLTEKSLLQKFAFIYFTIFFGVVALNYLPAIHDSQGLMFGLFKLDPIDDLLHITSAIWALSAGFYSFSATVIYFRCFGIAYCFDGLFGILVGKGFLDAGFLSAEPAVAGLLQRVELNAPHILLGGIAIYLGFYYSQRTIARK